MKLKRTPILGAATGILIPMVLIASEPEETECQRLRTEAKEASDEFRALKLSTRMARSVNEKGEELALRREESFRIAVERYTALYRACPDADRMGMMALYLDGRRYEEALPLYEQYLGETPEAPPEVWRTLGFIYWRLGRLQDALGIYERLIDRDAPNNADRAAVVNILRGLGRDGEAEEYLGEVDSQSPIPWHPKLAEASKEMYLAKKAIREGRPRSALAHLRRSKACLLELQAYPAYSGTISRDISRVDHMIEELGEDTRQNGSAP